MPVASVIRWCLLPVLPRSTGLRPVLGPLLTPECESRRPPPGRSPGRSHCGAWPGGTHAAAATRRPRSTQPGAGHTRTEAEFLRQMFPGDPGVQHEKDALEHQPVRMPLAPRVPGPTLDLGQQRLDHRPQLVIDLPRLRSSHPTPPDHQSRTDPTTSKIISLGVLSAPSSRSSSPPPNPSIGRSNGDSRVIGNVPPSNTRPPTPRQHFYRTRNGSVSALLVWRQPRFPAGGEGGPVTPSRFSPKTR